MAEKKKAIKKKAATIKKTVKKKAIKKTAVKKTAVKTPAVVPVSTPQKKEIKKKAGGKKLLKLLVWVVIIVGLFFLYQTNMANSQKMTVEKFYAHAEKINIVTEKKIFQKWLSIPNESAVVKLALYEDGSYDLGLLIFNKNKKTEPVVLSGKWWSPDKYTIKLRINNKDEKTGEFHSFNGSRYITLTLNHNIRPVLMEFEGMLFLERI